MFFELDGKTYRVKFQLEGTTTIAELYKVNSDGKLVDTGLFGMAVLYYKDIFSKSKGRKEALADLLDMMEQVFSTILEINFNKTVRQSIWEEYFKTYKK